MDEVGRPILAHHLLWIANPARCELGCTKLARVGDQRPTERETLRIVARKGTRGVTGAGSQLLGQGSRIKRFRDVDRDVRRATKAA